MSKFRTLSVSLLAAATLAACAPQPDILPGLSGDSRGARDALVAAAARGPIRAEVIGGDAVPYPSDAVLADMARGVSRLTVTFTEDAKVAAAPEPHLVIAFSPSQGTTAGNLCRSFVATNYVAGEPARVAAAFCDGTRSIADVRGTAAAPGEAAARRMVWGVSTALFPDNYANSYGFGFLGNRVGIGGSTGF